MNALDALLHGLFDYAGMFPPAELPLDDALREAQAIPKRARPDMVGVDFVVRHAQLEALHQRAANGPSLRVAVVGVPVDAPPTVLPADTALQIQSVEIAGDGMPPDAIDSIRRSGTRVYWEPQWSEAKWVAGQAALLAKLNAWRANGPTVGLKVRAAGPTAVRPERLLSLLVHATASAIPFKVTQGLHHPILETRYKNDLGFVNLAFAHAMARLRPERPHSDLMAILRERDPAAYRFGPEAVWRGTKLSAAEIATARRESPLAIGSCSLDEPEADLARLWR